MKVIHSPDALRRLARAARARGSRIGFVPTMGFLHAGHLSLVRRARRECDLVITSIFVNRLQFGPGEDYDAYPRSLREDRSSFRREGIDLCFEPRAEEFYPEGFSTRVSVAGLDAPLCGSYRPGHFTGVATVVMKLLASAEPDRLYLGGKDYQQARVLDRMARDLNLAVRVRICPTVRDPDGLALSSRNSYLSPEERAWAPRIYQALRAAAAEIRAGRIKEPGEARRLMRSRLRGGLGRLQYAEVLAAEDLRPVRPLSGRLVLAVAVFLGKARLIDNVIVRVPGSFRSARVRGMRP